METVSDSPFGRRFDLWGAAAGAMLGVGDTLLLALLGVDMRVEGRDGTWLVAGVFAFNLTLVGYLAGSLYDARRRERAQQARLDEARRQAFENEKLAAIGRLAAGIAHEVRNPLGVMRASAAMVGEQFPDDENTRRACGFVVDEADRLNGLITALLAFARPTRIDPRPCPLQPLLDRALSLARASLAPRQVEVRQEVTALRDTDLQVDPDLIAQVLLCLLTNAGEAIGDRGNIAIEASGDAQTWCLKVADDGPGIAEDDRARLFEPFFTTKDRGTGLGLAMAAQIARAHGGSLRLLPGAGAGPGGRGACFELRVPWAPAGVGAAA
jgi:two-component system sensor histidine kinase HydH